MVSNFYRYEKPHKESISMGKTYMNRDIKHTFLCFSGRTDLNFSVHLH